MEEKETDQATHSSAILAPQHVDVHVPRALDPGVLLRDVLARASARVILPALARVQARHERVRVQLRQAEVEDEMAVESSFVT